MAELSIQRARFRDYRYLIGRDGSVFSEKYGRTLTPHPTAKGYLTIQFWHDASRKTLRLHRVVWEAWNGPIPFGLEVNHLDFDKANCFLRNLELLPHIDNVRHAAAAGRCGRPRKAA